MNGDGTTRGAREARLAERLRDNLHRRKQQARGGGAADAAGDTPPPLGETPPLSKRQPAG